MARDRNPEDDDPGTLLFGDDDYDEDEQDEPEEVESRPSLSRPEQAQRSLFETTGQPTHEATRVAQPAASRFEPPATPPPAALDDLRYQGPISMDDVEDEPDSEAASEDTGQRKVFLTAAAIGAVIVSLFGAAVYMRSSTEDALNTSPRPTTTAKRPNTAATPSAAPGAAAPSEPGSNSAPESSPPPTQIAETKPAEVPKPELTQPLTRPRSSPAEASHREIATTEQSPAISSGSRQPGLTQLAQRGRERLRAAPAGSWTIQLLVACQSATVERAFREVESSQLVAVPVELKGQSCYRLCWGIYPSRNAATDGISKLPNYFGTGTSPRAVSVEAVANP